MTLSQKLRVPIELGDEAYYAAGVALTDDAPAVRSVDEIFDSAINARASDIHLEPFDGGGRVRERVDGVLREARRIAEPLFARIVSRIKLLAGMDIADRRLPQDGRYAVERAGRQIDARISSMPTIAGEKLAVRLLETHARIPSLESLGMPSPLARRYRQLVHAPTGFIVVCGPTGSGKTTTLYASMALRNLEGQHLCSIEDPVELRLPGVAQVQTNARAGLTFSVALRSFLRQDPNVIMIGEMRDAETAAVAVSAALCGQLVLTTLHGDDAARGIARLIELGVNARSVGAAVSGIVSQRLVRQLCAYCKRSGRAESTAERFGIHAGTAVYEKEGCERCEGTGYRGRSAIFELAVMTAGLRQAIENDATPEVFQNAAGDGYVPLRVNAARLVLNGETSIDEVARILGGEVR